MFSMIYKAPAKINIGLDITGIRDDGYHLLDTIMQAVDIFDELEITPRDDARIVVSCDDPRVPLDEHNLIYKAIRLLTDKGVEIDLKKKIPMEAGMGGGSSDAAAAMKAVNEIFKLGYRVEELEQLAVKLGADVPFFIKGGRQRCQGIGEILTELPSQEYFYVIVKPDVSASTKEIYAGYDEMRPAVTEDVINVLEPVTARIFPVINEIKNKLKEYGAERASMTGSGTAVFGEFRNKETAEKCADRIGGKLCQSF